MAERAHAVQRAGRGWDWSWRGLVASFAMSGRCAWWALDAAGVGCWLACWPWHWMWRLRWRVDVALAAAQRGGESLSWI